MNPEVVKKADFYLGYWELFGLQYGGGTLRYPECGTSFHETAFTALVYHPKFGDAIRDQQGKLLVRYPGATDRQPISTRFFHEWGFLGQIRDASDPEQKALRIDQPHAYLSTHGRELVARGLLRPEDFSSSLTSGSPTAEDKRKTRMAVGSRGQVMLGGVIHYLGKDLHGKEVQIVELRPGVGGIFQLSEQGKQELAYTFQILSKDDPRLSQVKYGSQGTRGYAGPQLIERKPATEEERMAFSSSQEQTQDWMKRLQVFEGAVGYSLRALPVADQRRFAEWFPTLSPEMQDEVRGYAKTFQLPGIKLLLALQERGGNALSILSLSKEIGVPMMRTVLKRMEEIRSVADVSAEALWSSVSHAEMKKMDPATVTSELMDRAFRILETATEISHERQADAEAVLRGLERHSKDVLVLASVFKAAKLGNVEGSLEWLHGVRLVRKGTEELSDDERRQMLFLLERNWKHLRPAAVDQARSELLPHGTNTPHEFLLLTKQEKVLGFVRFDTVEHAGQKAVRGDFFNTDEVIQGSGIGEAMLRASVDQFAKEKVVLGEFYPDSDVGAFYLEKMGFVGTGFEEERLPNGKTHAWVSMRRDDQRRYGSRAKEITLQVVRSWTASGAPNGIRVEVLHETGPALEARMREAFRRYPGMVMTRYLIDREAGRPLRYIVFEPEQQASVPLSSSAEMRSSKETQIADGVARTSSAPE